MINSLLTKFYNKYAIIYVQYSPKKFYINYYKIIHASHGNLLVLTKSHVLSTKLQVQTGNTLHILII